MTNGIKITIVVGCFLASGTMLFHHFTGEQPGPHDGARSSFSIRSNTDCATGNAAPPHERPVRRGPWQRPKCGSDSGDIAGCPSCARFHQLVGHGRYLPECPHCEASVPPLVEERRDAKDGFGG